MSDQTSGGVIFAWIAGLSGAAVAVGTLVRNAIVVSSFITFLSNLRPSLDRIQANLASIASSAANAEKLAIQADADAKQAVKIANAMSERMADRLSKQDEMLERILAQLKVNVPK